MPPSACQTFWPLADVAARDHHAPSRGDDLIGNGRHFLVDASADPTQDGKGGRGEYQSECNPEFFHEYPSEEVGTSEYIRALVACGM